MSRNIDDSQLIEQVKNGSLTAFRTLVERHQDYVYTICYRILSNREDAEEVSQDVFVKAYNALRNFQGQSKFTTWIYRIAINSAISLKRRKKIPLETIEEYKHFDQGEISDMSEVQRIEQRKFLQIAMNSLLPDDVSVLTLFYFKELSLEEISETTGINVNTLKVKLFRARKRLSVALSKLLKNEVNSLI